MIRLPFVAFGFERGYFVARIWRWYYLLHRPTNHSWFENGSQWRCGWRRCKNA